MIIRPVSGPFRILQNPVSSGLTISGTAGIKLSASKGDYVMAKTDPIRDRKDMRRLVKYFEDKKELRNCALVVVGYATALRITDELNLTWEDVYDFGKQCFKIHIDVTEQKTKKQRQIRINRAVEDILTRLMKAIRKQKGVLSPKDYIFSNGRQNGKHISRVQAWRILKKAVKELKIEGNIACHSLRKSFGYYAWKFLNVSSNLLMSIFNHSTFEVTKNYLGIDQDEKDEVYLRVIA